MKISKYKNIIIKILIVLICITILNFIITKQIIDNQELNNNIDLRGLHLNEEMHSITNPNQNLTKDFFINDIDNLEQVIRNDYQSMNFDTDAKLSYYKRVYDAYDSRLTLLCNEIKKHMTNDNERKSIEVLLYNFKIDRINIANEEAGKIDDTKLRLIEYYKNLSIQTKEKSLDFISKYEGFIDN